ncbi:hypothetical protein JKG47_06370 [Acidithiobacillus sp. MC6.1]|nr:hypothetical protein [Acidithiobacillus sp. MC6.1]
MHRGIGEAGMAYHIVAADTSPIIHLAMIDGLGLLEQMGVVMIPDMVVIESFAKDGPETAHIRHWLDAGVKSGRIAIPETEIGKAYRLALKADPAFRMRNAGEQAILGWIMDYVDRTSQRLLVIYENGKVPRMLSQWDIDADIDVMTTRSFLHACQQKRLLADAEVSWGLLAQARPSANPAMHYHSIRRHP